MLGRVATVLLVAEVVLCFTPVIGFLLVFAIVLIPLWLSSIAEEPSRPLDLSDLLYFGGVSIGGVLGLIGLTNVLSKIVNPNYKAIRPRLALIFAGLGIFAVIPFAVTNVMGPVQWMFIVPLVASLHILYLGRNYLFANESTHKEYGT